MVGVGRKRVARKEGSVGLVFSGLVGRLRVAFLGRGLLLFEFESLSEAKRVWLEGKEDSRRMFCILQDGIRRRGISGKVLALRKLG